MASVKKLANISKIWTVILKRQLPPKINLDPYYVKCEFATFVAHLLLKDTNVLSTHKAASYMCTSVAETVSFDEQVVSITSYCPSYCSFGWKNL